jgi:hypothetical protein
MSQLNVVPTYPITEPTSSLQFGDLLLHVALKLSMAYYGSTGQSAAQIPIDPHDYALCAALVNSGIRMFLSDGPSPNGWRFTKPIGQIDFWPIIQADQFLGCTSWISVDGAGYDPTTNLTTLDLNYSSTVQPSTIGAPSTNAAPQFYPSMELRQLWLGGNPLPQTPGWFSPPIGGAQVPNSTIGVPFTIVSYLSPTQVQVWGNATETGQFTSTSTWAAGNSTLFSIPTQGDYTMPADFAGSFSGPITYVANTNRGLRLHWIDESLIRNRRSNYNFETGTPYECAIRPIPTPTLLGLPNISMFSYPQPYAPQRRRYELMVWRISNEYLHCIFPYILSFNDLVNLTDLPPAPFLFDEVIKAACSAAAEKDKEDSILGPDWAYYRNIALPNAYRIDAMGANKSLGYNANRGGWPGDSWRGVIEGFRNADYQRPNVQGGGNFIV